MKISSPNAGGIAEVKQEGTPEAAEKPVSRRIAMGGVAFFGAAMSAVGSRAFAQPGSPGSYSGSAIAAEPPGDTPGKSDEDIVRAVKIARAMRSGPPRITRDATVAEMDHQRRPCPPQWHQRVDLHARRREQDRRSPDVRR